MRARVVRRWPLLLVLFLGLPANVRGGEPVVRNLSLRGLQIGGGTTLVIDGDDLGAAPRLLLPFAAKWQQQPGGTPNRATFAVTLDGDVEPGYHQLRVVTDDGVSKPEVIAVDRLPQLPLAATVEQLPAALHGAVSGSAVVETRFTGKAGQKVRIEVEAQRLGSKLRPVLHLLGPKRLQLAWAWPTFAVSGDVRLEATLPEDGVYTVSLHDLEYAPPGPGFFRLRIGQWLAVEQVFPPAAEKGRATPLELIGLAAPLRAELPASPTPGAVPIPVPKDQPFSGPRPFVLVSPHAEVVRQMPAGKVQELPAGPVGASGRLLKPFDEDLYRVPVTPRSKLRLEVFAERSGSPLDAALSVRNEQGGEVARAEDSPGSLDPVLEYAVPDGVSAVVVAVVDSQGRGGPHAVYRLVVEPQRSGARKTGFRLLTPAAAVALPSGGRAVVPVLIDRGGYQGPVALSAEGVPVGVRLEGTDIPEDGDGALVTVQRGDAPVGAVVSRWRGRAADGEERSVSIRNHPLERLQPWLATEIAVAATVAKADAFQIDWRGLPPDVGIVPGVKLPLPIKAVRPAGNNFVRLILLTSQLRPLVNGVTDPNQSLRPEKPVELPPNAADGELVVLVPPQPPASVYDLTVQADLLGPDRKTVLAVAFAPVRRMVVRHHVVIRLDGPPRIEAQADAKMPVTVKIQGQIERREGLTGDVTLTLAGLPPGVAAAPVVVKTGTTAFAVSVVLPPGFAGGEIADLKLFATAAAQPNVVVRSRDVELTLVVKAAAK
jgi:hypothetical protein